MSRTKGCVTLTRAVTSLLLALFCGPLLGAADDKTNFRVAFTYRRLLELEPCGCSLLPSGGLEREWYAQSQVRKAATRVPLHVWSGGTTFAPPPELFVANELPQYLERARALASALAVLKTEVVGLTVEDGVLSVQDLKKLEKKSKARFIATNAVDLKSGKAPFPTFGTVKVNSITVGILSLGLPSDRTFEGHLSLKWTPLAESIASVLAANPSITEWIAINNLLENDRRLLNEKFPQIKFWFGGADPHFYRDAVYQRALGWVDFSFEDRGRSLGLLSVQLGLKKKGFRNETQVQMMAAEKEELKAEQNPAESIAKKIQRRLGEIEQMTAVPVADTAPYTYYAWKLNYEVPTTGNPMPSLLLTYRNKSGKTKIVK